MVRQARSEVTRRKIIDAAVDLFTESGYAPTGLAEIIEVVGVTKGALYYHFDSKESLAGAIISDGGAMLMQAFDSIASAPAPALENLIHGLFVVGDLIRTDKLVASAVRLSRSLGKVNEEASGAYTGWLKALSVLVTQALEQGDVRGDVDSAAVAELVLATSLGLETLSSATSSGVGLTARLTRAWEVLLPAIATEQAMPYFREYLARESIRHGGSDSAI